MYYYNYFVTFTVIFLLLTLMIFLSIKLLNSKKNSDYNKKNVYDLWVCNFNNLTSSIYNTKKNSNTVYLTNGTAYMDKVKQQVKDIYLKTIILMNSKNTKEIRSCEFLSDNIKDSIILNLKDIELLPINQVQNIEIVSIIDNKIIAIITSTMIGDDSRNIIDTWYFTNGDKITLDGIEVKLYRKNKFIHMTKMLNLEQEKEVLI